MFCVKDDEFCIKNDEFGIKNDEFCITNDEFCRLVIMAGSWGSTTVSLLNAMYSPPQLDLRVFLRDCLCFQSGPHQFVLKSDGFQTEMMDFRLKHEELSTKTDENCRGKHTNFELGARVPLVEMTNFVFKNDKLCI